MMKKKIRWLALASAGLLLAGCSASAEDRIGAAQGYGGELRVSVSLTDGRITQVRVLSHQETEGVGTLAIDALPERMVSANSADVDIVSGATVTSNALIAAVRQALGSDPSGAGSTSDTPLLPEEVRTGVGICATGRIGPGTDTAGKPVKSLNAVAACGVFDADGRLLDLRIDQLEASSPDLTLSDEAFLASVAVWDTKGMRGEDYRMTSGTWREEMDAYERLFTGMTVDEVIAWFTANCSDETGKPLTGEGSSADQAKYRAMSETQLTALADVTSKATISLRDEHGDVITAIQRAWDDARR